MSAHSKAQLAPRLPAAASLVAHGAIGREFCAQAPAIGALLMLFGLLHALLIMGPRFGLLGQSAASMDLFVITALFASLICGVFVGAEEEENGTADFPRRLPVARMRIFLEKILGAILAFAAWAIAALLIHGVISLVATGRFAGLHDEIHLRHVGVVTLLLASGVLGGQIGRKAVVGALLAGVLMAPPMLLWGGLVGIMPREAFVAFLIVSVLYLLAAAIIFVRREGK